MSCHTWGYRKIKDLTTQEYEAFKAYCDEIANDILSDTITAEEKYEKNKEFYEKNDITLEDIRERIESEKRAALYYKSHINSNPTLIRMFAPRVCLFKHKEWWIEYGGDYDKYLRIGNYPKEGFTNPKKLIRFCYKNGWKHVYWFDDEWNLIKGDKNIKEAKERIRRMFNENKGVLIDFG